MAWRMMHLPSPAPSMRLPRQARGKPCPPLQGPLCPAASWLGPRHVHFLVDAIGLTITDSRPHAILLVGGGHPPFVADRCANCAIGNIEESAMLRAAAWNAVLPPRLAAVVRDESEW